jgi:hypothetical protein
MCFNHQRDHDLDALVCISELALTTPPDADDSDAGL